VNVAVICRAKGHQELRRKLGWWSYPVEGLTWSFFPQAEPFKLERAAFSDFDLIVQEDWTWGEWLGKRRPRVVYVIVDANTSERRRWLYREQATKADLLLLDQCDPAEWGDLGKPAHHWAGCVNEALFRPLDKITDVGIHMQWTADRRTLVGQLAELSERRPYAMSTANFLPVDDYAAALGRDKVVVHLGTHPQCRSHRVFDALAAGCCLLTSPLPDAGDGFRPGTHYLEWRDFAELTRLIDDLLATGAWQLTAEQGRAFVLAHHTWRTRAQEFIDIVTQEHLC
jgi:hypothetical protein